MLAQATTAPEVYADECSSDADCASGKHCVNEPFVVLDYDNWVWDSNLQQHVPERKIEWHNVCC